MVGLVILHGTYDLLIAQVREFEILSKLFPQSLLEDCRRQCAILNRRTPQSILHGLTPIAQIDA